MGTFRWCMWEKEEYKPRSGENLAPVFHRGMPGYAPTPLVSLGSLAEKLGVKGFFVKDESGRFGLGAFKVLGGSYAMARILCQRAGIPLDEQTFGRLSAPEFRESFGEVTFVTATDGNHGRGVAWMARQLGMKAVVYMPKGTVPERLENIRALGAEAEILEGNYDHCVRHAAAKAEELGWILVQDTAWPGYETIPGWIMEGYGTMAGEAAAQLPEGLVPTHLFLQAGVGSMAAAVAEYFARLWGEKCPRILIVEPEEASCFYLTAQAGEIRNVVGEMNSIMAGLCCGEPCTLAWEILRKTACCFISCPDSYAEKGMRLLGLPMGEDARVVSGESGAVTAGVAAALMEEPELDRLRRHLGMDENSVILCISTEGDTDKENYRRVLSVPVDERN